MPDKTKKQFAIDLATFDIERREMRVEIKDLCREGLKNFDKETRTGRALILQAFDQEATATRKKQEQEEKAES